MRTRYLAVGKPLLHQPAAPRAPEEMLGDGVRKSAVCEARARRNRKSHTPQTRLGLEGTRGIANARPAHPRIRNVTGLECVFAHKLPIAMTSGGGLGGLCRPPLQPVIRGYISIRANSKRAALYVQPASSRSAPADATVAHARLSCAVRQASGAECRTVPYRRT